MRLPLLPILAALSLPLAAQTWDVRFDVPFPEGQNLPQTLLAGANQVASGRLDTGHGFILGVNHRIWRLGPVLKLNWGVEAAHWTAGGTVQQGSSNLGSRLKQYGAGIGVDAQFWVPFTGLAGEVGLIQRLQHYQFEANGAGTSHDLSRTWFRVGIRARVPLPVIRPYLMASYQQPVTKDRPVHLGSVNDLAAYLKAQGSGQEFQRLWTIGVGLEF